MTNSDVERRLTELLHQHAEEAITRTDTATELNKFQDRVDQDNQGRNRRKAGTAAAALSAAAVAIGALWFSFSRAVARTGEPSVPSRRRRHLPRRLLKSLRSRQHLRHREAPLRGSRGSSHSR